MADVDGAMTTRNTINNDPAVSTDPSVDEQGRSKFLPPDEVRAQADRVAERSRPQVAPEANPVSQKDAIANEKAKEAQAAKLDS